MGNQCLEKRSTFQIVLYENTNAIEVYIDKKAYCPYSLFKDHIIGIQNWAGNKATTVPGFNPAVGPSSEITQKAYRFVPNGPSLLSGNIELLDENNNVIQSVPNPGGANGEINVSFDDVCYGLNPPNEQKFKVRAVYQACSGNDITVLDTIYVSKPVYVPPPNADSAFFYCVNDSASPIVASTTTSGYTLKWYDENELEISVPTPSTSVVGVTTYYVTQSSAECESDKFPIQIHIQEGTVEDDILAICKSELPFTKHGITWDSLTAAGVYSDTVSVKSLGGCDSVIYVSLTIHPEYEIVLDTAICVSELPITLHNNTWDTNTVSGDYIHTETYAGIGGCDSTHIVNLTIHPEYELALDTAICVSELPVTIHNKTWVVSTGPGDYTHIETYSGVGGCDSTHIVNLTIHPEYEFALDTAICVSDLPVTIHNNTWVVSTDPGNYTHTEIYSGIGGCDSTYHVNLMINDYITDTLEATICEGESFVFNGITYTSGVTLQDNITDTFATAGCDSIVTLVLNVNPTAVTTLTESICPGATFSFGGQDLSSTGVYTDTLQTTLGCDSVITLILDIDDYIMSTLEKSICEGDSYVFNGITYTSAITLQDNITDTFLTAGCDSIVSLILDINPVYSEQEVLELCASELPYLWNGINIPGGVVTQNDFDSITYTTVEGCDSVISLNLVINDTFQFHETMTVCSSDLPITWHQYTFDSQLGVGSYTESATYQTLEGCDSAYFLTLNVKQSYQLSQDTTICKDSFPFTWHGYVFTNEEATVLSPQIPYVASNNCDSIISLNVNVFPTPEHSYIYEEGCESIVFEGNTYNQSVTFVDTIFAQSGCDSLIRNIDISVLPTYYEKLVLDFSGCDSVVFQGQTYYSNTQIIDTFFTIHGCDSLVKETNININHFDLQLNASLDTVYRGEVVHLETNASSAYSVLSWTPVSLFPYQNATRQYVLLEESGYIEVSAKNLEGCVDTASLYLYLKELDKRVFVPNAFSPNDDGLNDEFGPEIPVNRGYMIENFSVYNRYGERVFFSSGQLNKKWNGTLRGAPADMGVYFYVLVVRFLDGDRFEAKGEVNLIR